MDPAVQAPQPRVALLDMFEAAKGKEYSLPWGLQNASSPGDRGTIKATGYFFNYYFLPAAFGIAGAGAYEVDVAAPQKPVVMHRRIGGPGINVERKAYKYKQYPTSRARSADGGQNLYARDGEKLWNFEIGGDINKFQEWLVSIKDMGLKKSFFFRTEGGTWYTSASVSTALPGTF